MLTSLVVLTLLYLALAVVEVGLIVRYAKAGPPAPRRRPPRDAGRDAGRSDDRGDRPGDDEPAERPLTFAY